MKVVKEFSPPFLSKKFSEEYWEIMPVFVNPDGFSPPYNDENLLHSIVKCIQSGYCNEYSFLRFFSLKIINLFQKKVPKKEPLRYMQLGFSIECYFSKYKYFRKWQGRFSDFILKKYLPKFSDGSISSYHQRIKKLINPPWRRFLRLPERRYMFTINNIELSDYSLWEWSKKFLTPLFAEIGLNNGGIYSALFLGDYKKTRAGVHLDNESVFHIPIVGEKIMRMWSHDYVNKNPKIKYKTNYIEHIENSIFLTAHPGSFIYWPSSYWHVSENSSGQFSASLALSLIVMSEDTCAIKGKIKIGSEASKKTSLKTVPFNPYAVTESMRAIPLGISIYPINSVLTESVTLRWLKFSSAMGFIFFPNKDENTRIEPDEAFRVNPAWPVNYFILPDNKLILAMNGHLVLSDYNQPLLKLIDFINLGSYHTINELNMIFSSSLKVGLVSELVHELIACRLVTLQG